MITIDTRKRMSHLYLFTATVVNGEIAEDAKAAIEAARSFMKSAGNTASLRYRGRNPDRLQFVDPARRARRSWHPIQQDIPLRQSTSADIYLRDYNHEARAAFKRIAEVAISIQ